MKRYKIEFEFIDKPITEDGEEYLTEEEIRDFILFKTFSETTGVDVKEETLKIEEIHE